MNPDHGETPPSPDTTLAAFAYSLLEEILTNVTHPARINRQLAEQLHAHTGAGLVVLARRRELDGGHELAAFEPQRRRPIAESAAMMALAAMTADLDGPTLWERGSAPLEAVSLMAESLPGPAAAVPLQVGKEHVGTLLLFDLPDDHNLNQVIDALGTLARVVALIFQNTTLHEKQETTIANRTRKLTEEHDRLEVTLHSIGDAVISTDVQGRVTLMNPVAEYLAGWQEAEAQGRPLDEIFHIINEETRQAVESPTDRMIREGVVVGLANHTLLVARDGTERPIADSGAPIRNAQGEISGVILVFRDQTEERAAQEALRKSEERFRSLFDQAAVSIWEEDFSELKRALDDLSAQGVADFRAYFDAHPEFIEQAASMVKVLDINDETVRIFEAESKEALLGSLYKTFTPDSLITFRNELLAIVRGETRFEQPTIVQTLRGRPLHVLLRLTILAGHPSLHRVLVSLMDVTGQVEAEEHLHHTMTKLAASEKRLKTIIETEPECVKILSPNGLLVDMNRAGLDMIEADSLAQVRGQSILLIIAPEYRRPFRAMLKRVMRGHTEALVFEIIGLKGTRRWLETHSAPLYEAGDKITGLLGVTRDITERKQVEVKLKRSEEKFRKAFTTSPDSININRLQDGMYVSINEGFTRIMGYTEEDVIGKTSLELDIWADPEDRGKLVHGLRTKGMVENLEAKFRAKNGGVKDGLMSASVIDLDGIPHILSVTRDITERKRVEAERSRLAAQVREQAQELKQIMDTVPTGVLLLNAEGRLLRANPVAENDLAVLDGVRVGDMLTHLGDRPLAALLTSPPTQGIWHEVKADGRTFEVLARPMTNGHELENWALVINDVTQEREIRAQLQQQERLAAVGQLAAGIAHDFNNIMASIVLYAGMAAKSQGLSERNLKRMTVINRQAWHASRLIEQILDFSRRGVLERQPLDLLPLLKEQIKLLERTLPEHIGIELGYGQEEYIVHADPTRMQQMLTNLAVNARDAMPDGGILHIALARIADENDGSPLVPDLAAGEWIRLTVTDTGTGIPPDALPHIFEPFFTTKGPGEGSGLGLAQVHGIVGQHGGRIGVESRMGAGTTFTIYLPALGTHSIEPSRLAISAMPLGQGETLLVVEDETTLRAALVSSLEKLNYRALAAANGKQALAAMAEQGEQIALVLSDVVMPVMGGIALFHTLRQKGWETPVVLLTGHPMDKTLNKLREQGLAAWLAKPLSLERLAQVIDNVLRG